MQHKWNLTTIKITKYNDRLNLNGEEKQVYGMIYYETYVSIVFWYTLQPFIIFGIIFRWSLQQVDFGMAYPWAPIKIYMCMELLQGIEMQFQGIPAEAGL